MRITGLLAGLVFGFTLAWARLSDARVIRDMLLQREGHVFLVMGTAVAVAAVGVRLLRRCGMRTVVTHEAIRWTLEPPRVRHVGGSVLFGAGWMAAGTCPGPLAAMIGQGQLWGLPVLIGLLAGVRLQPALSAETKPSLRTAAAATVPGL